jgi:hypothetical protein
MTSSRKLSIRYCNRLNIIINKSLLLIVLVSTAHLGGVVILMILPMAWWYQISTIALVSASLFRCFQLGVLSAQGQWTIREDGSCLGPAMTAHSESVSWQIVEAIRYPGWVSLQLHTRGRRARMLLVLRDAVEAQAYRELCARIEQHRLPALDQTPVRA